MSNSDIEREAEIDLQPQAATITDKPLFWIVGAHSQGFICDGAAWKLA